MVAGFTQDMDCAGELLSSLDETIVFQQIAVFLKGVWHQNVWLTQQRMVDLFGVQKAAISKHLKNIFVTRELEELATVSKMETVQQEGGRQVSRMVVVYNLDAIIAVGSRVNSLMATQFRIWVTGVLKSYLPSGYAFNSRMNQLGGCRDA